MPSPAVVDRKIRELLSDYDIHNPLRRYVLTEYFDKKPYLIAGLDGDASGLNTQQEVQDYTAINKHFTLSGTNAANTCVALDSGGGVALTTTTASGDSLALFPTVLSAVTPSGGASAAHTAWGAVSWLPSAQSTFQARFTTGASLPGTSTGLILIGFKLTNALDLTTDADHLLLTVQAATSTTQFILSSRVGSSTTSTTLTGPALAVSTNYDVRFKIGADYKAEVSVNSNIAGAVSTELTYRATSPALTSTAAFKPYFAIKNGTNAARAATLRYIRCSRLHA